VWRLRSRMSTLSAEAGRDVVSSWDIAPVRS
jgi:hypothetical protein